MVLVLICLPKDDIPDVNSWFHRVHFDKWVHAGMFALLGWLFMNPFRKFSGIQLKMKQQYYLRITMLVVVWGYLTECIQLFVPGRSYDLLDWAADSSGAILAFLIIVSWKK